MKQESCGNVLNRNKEQLRYSQTVQRYNDVPFEAQLCPSYIPRVDNLAVSPVEVTEPWMEW